MFDPRVGRWLEEDPDGFAAGDPNLDRYCDNSPMDATDPSGLDEEVDYSRQGISAFPGAADSAISGTMVVSTSAKNSTFQSNRPGITIAYRGRNAQDVSFIQFFKLRVWQLRPKPGGEPIESLGEGFIPRPHNETEKLEYSTDDSKHWYCDALPKVEQVAANEKRKKEDQRPITPYYHESGFYGSNQNGVATMYDNPTLTDSMIWNEIRKFSSGGKKADATVTTLGARIDFVTFATYKKKPFYRVDWAVKSWWEKAEGEDNDPVIRWNHSVSGAPFVVSAGLALGDVNVFVKALNDQPTQEFKGQFEAP